MIKKLFDLLKRMLVHRYCANCGEPMQKDVEESICDECYEEWIEWMGLECTSCGKPCGQCECIPPSIRNVNSLELVKWCAFYDTKRAGNFVRLFYIIKDYYDEPIVDLFAGRMCAQIVHACNEAKIDYKKFVITYVPRRSKGYPRGKYDHAKAIAKAVGKRLGLEVVDALVNISKKQQKRLSKEERLKNARESYQLKKNYKSDKKFYILVDDIITTGASVLACSKCLKRAGAQFVFPVAFAKTQEHN